MVRTPAVIALLMLLPFCQVFGAISLTQSLHSYVNYLSFALSIIALPAMRARLNLRIALLCTLGAAIYSLNYALGPFASVKWLINTFGFLFQFSVVANYMKTMGPQQLTSLERHFNRLMFALWGACVCLYCVTLYNYWWCVISFTTATRFNNSIYILTRHFGIQKQLLGLLFAAVSVWHVVYWGSFHRVHKVVFVLSIIPAIPFLIGIRTLLLSLGMLWMYVLLRSKKTAIPTKLGLFLVMPLTALFVLTWQGFDVGSLILQKYNRLPSLLFAIDTFRQYPQGLGNGGYTPFVLAQADSLFTEYGVWTYGLIKFPPAPESDIVYFIASFGLLCPVFFLFYVYILNRATHILHSCSPHNFEKFVLLVAATLIFGGISQDFAGKLAWWTYLGAATGLIFRYHAPLSIVGRVFGASAAVHDRTIACPA